MAMSVDVTAAMMESIPRLRWSPANNRFHYNIPIASEPGARGFVVLQEFEHADSFGTWVLPASERHHLEEMERINSMIADIENAMHLHANVKFLQNQRTHHDEEFHERDDTEEEAKGRTTKKKHLYHCKQAPRRSFETRRQKPTRVGRVHQPK